MGAVSAQGAGGESHEERGAGGRDAARECAQEPDASGSGDGGVMSSSGAGGAGPGGPGVGGRGTARKVSRERHSGTASPEEVRAFVMDALSRAASPTPELIEELRALLPPVD
ncbi:hypothetical protein GCM10022245_46590 [Streptomyces mayteni]